MISKTQGKLERTERKSVVITFFEIIFYRATEL